MCINHVDFHLIGLRNTPLAPQVSGIAAAIQRARVFSGGARHYALVKDCLPLGHDWIPIAHPVSHALDAYAAAPKPIVVFTSGDPFFYGFGNTLKQAYPEATYEVIPYFNSLQRLCHKTCMNYSGLSAVSLHGRDWSGLDAALIEGHALIGVLTDAERTPAAIANRLLAYGFDQYTITVGEALDSDQEQITTTDLVTCGRRRHDRLSCVLLSQAVRKPLPMGIADASLCTLPSRANLLTKLPIRLNTLHALGLHDATVFWDIGACTGAISIEARRQFPHLQVVAIEKQALCETVIVQNMHACSAPGIQVVMADFFTLDLDSLPRPEAVFIGGHGNKLRAMLDRLKALGTVERVVINAVQASSTEIFTEVMHTWGFAVHTTMVQLPQHTTISATTTISTTIHIHQAIKTT